MSVGRWRRPRYLLSGRQHLNPASLVESSTYNLQRDELDEGFAVGADTALLTYDDQWVSMQTQTGNGFEVVASTDVLELDANVSNSDWRVRWEGAKGDEIQADVTRGDQGTGEINIGLGLRGLASAVNSEDFYRVNWNDGVGGVAVHRFVAGSATQLGGNITHTFANGTTQNWRVWCRTMADRVRIYFEVDGVLVATRDDTSASRLPSVGFCGIEAFNGAVNTTGVRSGFDNIVIRSTPLVYWDEFDYVTGNSDLNAEDDWTRWRGAAGTDFLEMNAANNRLEVVTGATSVSIAYYWTAPSGEHPVGLEVDWFSGNADGTETASDINIRHNGSSEATAKLYQLGTNHQGAGAFRALITNIDRGGSNVNLLDLTTATPAFIPNADTLYHVVFWAETVDAATVRLHLVIDDQYWTVDDTDAQRIVADGRVGFRNSQDAATGTMYWDNIRIYDSPPKLLVGPAGQAWVRLADSFTVTSDTQLDVYDPLWVDAQTPIGTAPQFDVIAVSDKVVWDSPNGAEVKLVRWEGAVGDEIELDLHLGDQTGEVLPMVLIRDQGSAAASDDMYWLKWFDPFWRLSRRVAAVSTQIGAQWTIPFAKDTAYHIKLTAETLADRVRITFQVGGRVNVWEDTGAARWTIPGFAGFGHEQQNANTSGVKTSFDNIVIRQHTKTDTDEDYVKATSTLNTILVRKIEYRVRRDVYRSVKYPVVTTRVIEAPVAQRIKFALDKPGFTPNTTRTVRLRVRRKTQ